MHDTRPETRLWHPFADMGAVRHRELTIARGEDVWVWDDEGRRYLDAFASLWYANVGHGRREIVDAVHEQMLALESYTTFFDYANAPAVELAERLATLSGLPDA
jgi:putrescine aminotransferase